MLRAKKWTFFQQPHIEKPFFGQPEIPNKSLKEASGRQHHKVATFITASNIEKTASQPTSQPAKLMTGFLYPYPAFLSFSDTESFETSLGLFGGPCTTGVSRQSSQASCEPAYELGF